MPRITIINAKMSGIFFFRSHRKGDKDIEVRNSAIRTIVTKLEAVFKPATIITKEAAIIQNFNPL